MLNMPIFTLAIVISMTNFIKFCVGLYIMSNKKDINVTFQFSDILLGKLEKVQKFVLDNQKQVFFLQDY